MKKIMRNKIVVIGVACMLLLFKSGAQQAYQYSVDLTRVENDLLTVELICPVIEKNEISFYFPKIVPGTYMNSNYGKYVQNLKVYDKAGKQLEVNKSGDNSWAIKKGKKVYRIIYTVEDTWDASIDNKVYSMCGTNFEVNKNFVINTPGIFGYFEGMKQLPFQLNFKKPKGFYAATGLKPLASSDEHDSFKCDNADHLYDSPIMFSLPDTATIKVGQTEVLIAVYSPNKLATSGFIAANLSKLLLGAKDYLFGKLPVDKYAFLFYFNGEQKKFATSGAWEHSFSSFYSLEESPQNESIANWVDISSHEFFHIVTPLTISSREVKAFNFNETVLSKHLWLYEGSTEYFAQHMQVWSGLKSTGQFLKELAQKLNYSRTYFKDTLSFTELSKESAGKWAGQYGNVYLKGALISACLDLYLLKLSNSQYGLRQLKHDLGIQFGKDKFFEDDSLFTEIEHLTYPEIKDFFNKYVGGSRPIPYEQFFAMAGVEYLPVEQYRDFMLGGIITNPAPGDKITVGIKDLNVVGKRLGYQEGDELVSINDSAVNQSNLDKRIDQLFSKIKEGDLLTIKVKRKHTNGLIELHTLTAPAMKVDKQRRHVLNFMSNPNSEQLQMRKAWLNNHTATVD